MRSRGLVRHVSSTALGLVAAFCVCSASQAKTGSSDRPARLGSVQSGTISLRQIKDVTTLTYIPKSDGAARRVKLSTPDGIFRGSFTRATLIGEIPWYSYHLEDDGLNWIGSERLIRISDPRAVMRIPKARRDTLFPTMAPLDAFTGNLRVDAPATASAWLERKRGA
jgi:hypothetical protein